MEFVFFPFLVIAQALPMVLAVVVGIALARWLGLFEPRGAQNGPRLRGRGLVVALGAVALVLLLVGLFFTPV